MNEANKNYEPKETREICICGEGLWGGGAYPHDWKSFSLFLGEYDSN